MTGGWIWVANFEHEHFRAEIAGVFLAVVLWQHLAILSIGLVMFPQRTVKEAHLLQGGHVKLVFCSELSHDKSVFSALLMASPCFWWNSLCVYGS